MRLHTANRRRREAVEAREWRAWRRHIGAVYCALDAIAVATFKIELEPFHAAFIAAATEGRAQRFGVAELLTLSTWPSGGGPFGPFRDWLAGNGDEPEDLLEHG